MGELCEFSHKESDTSELYFCREDIGRYHFDPDRSMLLPSKVIRLFYTILVTIIFYFQKKRVMVEGSSVTKEGVTIQETENVEDEDEVVVKN